MGPDFLDIIIIFVVYSFYSFFIAGYPANETGYQKGRITGETLIIVFFTFLINSYFN